MLKLEEKIVKEGIIINDDILKVGSFLNQQIDTCFLTEMGKEIYNLFKDTNPSKVVTIEASGIALAVVAAQQFGIPVVFVKKSSSSNQTGESYTSKIKSFTHDTVYTANVSKEYILKEDRILIVDDFLARGEALRGLIDIVNQAGSHLCGCCCAIEKGYQDGGDDLRKKGIKVESLAIIESMSNKDGIKFRH